MSSHRALQRGAGPILSALVSLVLVFAASGCGGGAAYSPPPPPPPTITSVTVSCSPTNIQVNQTSKCSVTVAGTGSFDSSVTWSVDNGAIDANGSYTAPAAPATATVKATSKQDSTKSGTATITVQAAPTITSVTVSCNPTTVLVGQTSQCSATVQGTGNFDSSVNWSVNIGSISSSGFFTAPNTAGTATAKAVSKQDSTKSGTAMVTVTPPPPTITSVTTNCNPTQLQVSQTSQCTANVQGTGNFDSSVTWSVDIGSISVSGVFTAPGTTGTATVRATSKQDSTKSGTATITVQAAPTITSVSVSCNPTTVLVGQTSQCTATVNGTGNFSTAVTWSLQGPGTVSNAGLYTAPATVSASTQVRITATSVQDSSKSGSATVTVIPPTPPTIVSVSPAAVFCPRECDPFSPTPIATITGTGFGVGDSISGDNGVDPPTVFPVATVTTNGQGQVQTQIQFPLDSSSQTPTIRYNPGPLRITITNANGTTNPGFFNILGNQEIVAVGKTKAGAIQYYVLDQGAKAVHVYSASLSHLFDFSFGGLATAIAVDDKTGNVVVNEGRGSVVYDPSGKLLFAVGDNASDLFMGVGAEGGFGCATAEQANSLSCFDLSQLLPAVTTIPIGATPMNVVLSTVNNQLTATVLNVGECTLASVNIPAMLAPQFVALPGCTKITQLYSPTSTAIFADGWQLKAFDSGVAAVLSRADRKVWFVNLTTKAVTGPFTVPDDPFRIAADNVHGVLVIALADTSGLSGGTRFVKIDVATGTVSQLQSTSSLLAVGLAVSQDGSQIIGCMRDACEAKPNN